MGFSYFIAVLGLVLATALIGFIVGGVHESERSDSTPRRGRKTSVLVTAGLAFMAITQGMVLSGSELVQPMWAMYLLLAALPATAGYIARRVLARRLSRETS